MKKNQERICIFDLCAMVTAMLVVIFIAIAMGAVLCKGLPHFGISFRTEELQFAIRLSLITASISTALCLLLAVPTAYALTKTSLPLRRLWEIIIELPLSLPYLVLGLSLMLVFSSPVGKWLADHGLPIVFSVNGIVLAHTMVNLPFVVRIIKTAFAEIDPRLEFIARTLGAGKSKCFFTITLPLAGSSILGAVILAWSRALGEFGATLMLVGATRMKTETLPTSIYLNMATGDMNSAMTSAIVLLFISACSLLIFRLFQPQNKQSRIT